MSVYGAGSTAGGTPITDDDSEDDPMAGEMAGANYSAGGGFTETVLDDNESHHDDDDEEAMGDAQFVDVDYEGQSIRVPLTNQVRTFGDIKRWLSETHKLEMSSSHFIVDTANEREYQEDDDVQLLPPDSNLVIRWQCFLLQIMDGLTFVQSLRVAEDFTIQRIKDQVEKERNVRLEQLSKDGLELQNDKTLSEYSITAAGHTLVSRISIEIQDLQCELQTDILVCEFWSIEDVLNVYLQSARREKHSKATLSLNSEVLDLHSTVFDENIKNQCRLQYNVGKYSVLVYDSEPGMEMAGGDQACLEVEVLDSQTITDIQECYARITRKPFMANDKLLSNERQLEENVPLFKLRIKDNEPLIIEREQQQKPAEYICAECGAIVSLRPYDAVQCRECFMNVVYKKRTLRVCQYNCR